MKNLLSCLFFIRILSLPAYGQQLFKTGNEEAASTLENIEVRPLFSDSLASTFLIFVKQEVPLHWHETHSETVYIIEGSGIMILEEQTFSIGPGDLIHIAPGISHSVVVTSPEPLKVISVQAPEFYGIDRVYPDQ